MAFFDLAAGLHVQTTKGTFYWCFYKIRGWNGRDISGGVGIVWVIGGVIFCLVISVRYSCIVNKWTNTFV